MVPPTFGENLLQRGPRLCRCIVNQDLQHWKPAKQLGAGFPSGLFVVETSLEVTVDNKRETFGGQQIRSLGDFGLNLFSQCDCLLHGLPHIVMKSTSGHLAQRHQSFVENERVMTLI